MKIVTIIARVLLGLMFVVFGLNGLHPFLPMQAPNNHHAQEFMDALGPTGYLRVIFALQLIGGLLLLSGWFVPLGLTILCPILVNILLFHICIEPQGIQIGAVITVIALFLIWRYWSAFAGLVRPWR